MARPGDGWGRRSRPAERRAAREPRVYRVGEVVEAIGHTLQTRFRDFWVEGEISQVTRPRSGHVYFDLSDEQQKALMKTVAFASVLDAVTAQLVVGERVRVRASVSFYPVRGEAQLVAKEVVTAGEGDLQARYEKLRRKLEAEGLFDPARKRPLPRVPRVIGVVTSRSSAALRDIVRVAHARAPVRLVVAHCSTQGDLAARSIVLALNAVQALPDLDVVILGRGGGSAEDLWAFNDEALCRAIAAARVPVVCGVGHESDTTLAEQVADVRASTPSNAAERAVPELGGVLAELQSLELRLQSALQGVIDARRIRLGRLQRRLADPRRTLFSAHRRLATFDQALQRAMARSLSSARERLKRLDRRLEICDPRMALKRDAIRLRQLEERLRRSGAALVQRAQVRHAPLALRLGPAIGRQLELRQRRHATRTERLRGLARTPVRAAGARLGSLAMRLEALSPLRVLGRGYAIAFGPEGHALTSARQVAKGDPLRLRLHDGELQVRVEGNEGAATVQAATTTTTTKA